MEEIFFTSSFYTVDEFMLIAEERLRDHNKLFNYKSILYSSVKHSLMSGRKPQMGALFQAKLAD
jgi:hypothetical protein